MSRLDTTTWLVRGPIKAPIGVSLTQKAFSKTLKEYGIDDAVFIEDAFASTQRFTSNTGGLVLIVCIDPKKFKGYSYSGAFGVIAHECLHVVQRYEDWIGERGIAREFTAGMLDWLVEEVSEIVIPRIAKQKIT